MPRGYFRPRLRDAFWSHVDKTPGGCWLWTRGVNGSGYGQLPIDGRYVPAHRYAYALAVGPVPNELMVCHSCDVRSCVNPAHLFLGTQRDNMRDMWAKGRGRRYMAERSCCKNGHAFTSENTKMRGSARLCRQCVREASYRYYLRNREHTQGAA